MKKYNEKENNPIEDIKEAMENMIKNSGVKCPPKYRLGIDNGELGYWAIVDENNKVIDSCQFPESTNKYIDEIKELESEIRKVNKNKDIPSSKIKYDELSKQITVYRKKRDNFNKKDSEYNKYNDFIKELSELRRLFNIRKGLRSKRRALSIKKEYNTRILYNFIARFWIYIDYAIIEAPIRQSAMGIDADTLIKSGEIYGINTCILKLFNINYYSVSPKIWQNELLYDLPEKEKDENNSKYLLRRRNEYKKQSIKFCNDLTGYVTNNDNEAEAVLIAMCQEYKKVEDEDIL